MTEIVALYIVWQYGKGENFYEKLIDFKLYPTIVFFGTIILSWFILGRERIRALGWPFSKIFKEK